MSWSKRWERAIEQIDQVETNLRSEVYLKNLGFMLSALMDAYFPHKRVGETFPWSNGPVCKDCYEEARVYYHQNLPRIDK